jgi:hypothetical protein
MSTVSSGSSQTGIDIALAGLGLQVAVLVFFCILLGDFLLRYFKSASVVSLSRRMRLFFGFLSLAVILILGRCSFRCYELSKGYTNSDLVTDQGLFIGLEGGYVRSFHVQDYLLTLPVSLPSPSSVFALPILA